MEDLKAYLKDYSKVRSTWYQVYKDLFEELSDTDLNDFLEMQIGASNLVYKLNLLELTILMYLYEWNLKLIYFHETSIKEVKEIFN